MDSETHSCVRVYRRYLAQELKAVQKELDAKQSPLKVGQLAAEETAARRAEYEKKLEERRTLKTDALSFLQQLEDELIRRRNVEKEAVNRVLLPAHRTRVTYRGAAIYQSFSCACNKTIR
jgi:Skp family chaperone for outer membrane proteins